MGNITFVNRWWGGVCVTSAVGGSVLALLSVNPAFATPPPFAVPTEVSTTNETTASAGFLTGISRRSYPLGDM